MIDIGCIPRASAHGHALEFGIRSGDRFLEVCSAFEQSTRLQQVQLQPLTEQGVAHYTSR